MPIYEMRCDVCEKTIDKLVPVINDDPILCEDCLSKGIKSELQKTDKLFTVGHSFRGAWFKTTGSY